MSACLVVGEENGFCDPCELGGKVRSRRFREVGSEAWRVSWLGVCELTAWGWPEGASSLGLKGK